MIVKFSTFDLQTIYYLYFLIKLSKCKSFLYHYFSEAFDLFWLLAVTKAWTSALIFTHIYKLITLGFLINLFFFKFIKNCTSIFVLLMSLVERKIYLKPSITITSFINLCFWSSSLISLDWAVLIFLSYSYCTYALLSTTAITNILSWVSKIVHRCGFYRLEFLDSCKNMT